MPIENATTMLNAVAERIPDTAFARRLDGDAHAGLVLVAPV
jgi:hypothetical protein